TSTYDGMALAQAIVEYIHHSIGAKTLFSTHYHELTQLEDELENVKNIYVRAEEYEDEVVFLHKIEEGRANESYGIHVAKLAELPDTLIERAQIILQQLESAKSGELPQFIADDGQLSFFAAPPKKEATNQNGKVTEGEASIVKQLRSLNVLEMTPLEAMNELYNLQKKIKK